jgi:hypothetical protein
MDAKPALTLVQWVFTRLRMANLALLRLMSAWFAVLVRLSVLQALSK